MDDQTKISAASADEKLARIQALLARMQELAQQVSSGQYTPEQCAALQQELAELRTEIESLTNPPA